RPLTFSLRRSCSLPLASLFSSFFLFGCLSSVPQYVPPTSDASFSETLKSLVRTRGLAPKRDVTLAATASADPAPQLAPGEFYNGAPVAEVERAYQSIGLLHDSTDFRRELAELRALEGLIRYDSARSTVSWSGDMARVAGALEPLDPITAQDLAPV